MYHTRDHIRQKLSTVSAFMVNVGFTLYFPGARNVFTNFRLNLKNVLMAINCQRNGVHQIPVPITFRLFC